MGKAKRNREIRQMALGSKSLARRIRRRGTTVPGLGGQGSRSTATKPWWMQ